MRSLLLFACVAAIPAVDIHLGAYAGSKQGDRSVEPVDRQFEYGLVAHVRPPLLPLGVQANWLQGRREADASIGGAEVTERLVVDEFQVGVGRVFDPLILVHPFIAGGISRTRASVTVSGAAASSESASAWGWWIQGGSYFSVGLLEIGALVGWSRADVDMSGTTINAGGKRIGLIVGFGF
jgi:hypothetical protein